MAENGKYVDLADVGEWLDITVSTDPAAPADVVAISDRVSTCISDAEAEIDTICRVSFTPVEETHYVIVRQRSAFIRLPRCQSVSKISEIFIDGTAAEDIDLNDVVLRTVSGGRTDAGNFRLYPKAGVWAPGEYEITGMFGYASPPGDIPPVARRRALQEYRRSDYLASMNAPATSEAAEAMFQTGFSKADYATLMKYRSRNKRLVVGRSR